MIFKERSYSEVIKLSNTNYESYKLNLVARISEEYKRSGYKNSKLGGQMKS